MAHFWYISPPESERWFYFDNIARALDIYTQTYDKILLTGDFNADENKGSLKSFLELYDLKNLVREKTCFKSLLNPSCVDLFLTNSYRSFQSTKAISTGISVCHKMIITVLKTTFKKGKPKEFIYRSYKRFDKAYFSKDLKDLKEIYAYGFSANALKLIRSYLSDRWQRVKINNSYSTWFALLLGVPQGSI